MTIRRRTTGRPGPRRPGAHTAGLALAAIAVVAAAALLAGCAGAPVTPAVVTVTSTVAPPPIVTTDRSPTTTSVTPAPVKPSAHSAASNAPSRPPTPTSRTTSAIPPTTSARPPTTSAAAASTSAKSPTRASTSTRPAATSAATHGAPPGTLSLGDLFANARKAAAAAGVAPADPDTPGPPTGPKCPSNADYVNEPATGLRSDVAAAWRAAVAAGAKKGITLCLNDGKRSRAQQQAQFDEYAEEYGTAVATQLVLPPNRSAHVVGIAVDVQPASAYRWLQSTGGSQGFCRIYDNEPWHFEFNPAYPRTGCPQRLPEPER